MSIQLGQIAPDFEQDSSQGKIKFYDYLGSGWGILFSHPKHYTPVCTTELAEVARLKPEWDKRHVKPLGLSVDTGERHEGWAADIEETQGQKLNPAVTVRSVFVIDPNKKVRLILTYPPSTGRNFQEILRVVDSLQLTDNHKVATPVNWQNGDDVIIVPSLSDEDAKTRFPEGWKTLKPYLRVVKQPKLPHSG
jgi:alkyl hydroperoxide reductase subunit AhpC